MARIPQTVRSTRTRAALRRSAMSLFLAQGVEATTAEQIAADAGVTLRTFYRHFASKHELLFADYDSGLQWFRGALAARPAGEPVLESVKAAIFAFPYDVQAITQLAQLRAEELDPERIVEHVRRVEADVAAAVAEHVERNLPAAERADPRRRFDAVLTARCIAAALFGAMEMWMEREQRSLADLAELSRAALVALDEGLREDGLFRHY